MFSSVECDWNVIKMLRKLDNTTFPQLQCYVCVSLSVHLLSISLFITRAKRTRNWVSKSLFKINKPDRVFVLFICKSKVIRSKHVTQVDHPWCQISFAIGGDWIMPIYRFINDKRSSCLIFGGNRYYNLATMQTLQCLCPRQKNYCARTEKVIDFILGYTLTSLLGLTSFICVFWLKSQTISAETPFFQLWYIR